MNVYRQGDVVLFENSKAKGVNKKRANRVVLAEGEITGHVHELVSDKPMDIYFSEKEEPVSVVLYDIGTIVHDDHSVIEVAPGTYWIVRQTEYIPGVTKAIGKSTEELEKRRRILD